MGSAFSLAYSGSLALTIFITAKTSFEFDSTLGICAVTITRSNLSIPAAAFALCYDLLAMGLTWWNVVCRPRVASTPLSRALAKDGFKFFLVSFSIQISSIGRKQLITRFW
jgi:hypothetical protein